MPIQTVGYAALAKDKPLVQHKYEVRDLKDTDIHIKVDYCGICHTDIHEARAEWRCEAVYPMVPGHEVVGTVSAVGRKVKGFKVGDKAGVGFCADSCRTCKACKGGMEQLCAKAVYCYNCPGYDGKITTGGFGKDVVIDEHFAVKIPDCFTKEEMAQVAPLLCAGITVWTPLVRHGCMKPGVKLGVVGLGGLGHMAVKFGVAFGNEVTVISTSETKRKEAMEVFKAAHFVNVKNPGEFEKCTGTFDVIIDTVAAGRPAQPLIDALAVGGTLISVALPPEGHMMEIAPFPLIMQQKSVCGSLVGGMGDMQVMMDFCAKNHIVPLCETVTGDKINEAFERILKADIRYRFVIDQNATTYN